MLKLMKLTILINQSSLKYTNIVFKKCNSIFIYTKTSIVKIMDLDVNFR